MGAKERRPSKPAAVVEDPVAGGLPPGLEPAGFGRRIAAFAVDALLSDLVALLFVGPHRLPGNWSLLVFFVMYTVFVGFFAQSPGLRLLGLRCEGIVDGRPIGLFRAGLRTVLVCLLFPALIPGPDGRPWHDKIVGSILIRRRPTA
jgi:uncharacterized RDD family membrane protein YckC